MTTSSRASLFALALAAGLTLAARPALAQPTEPTAGDLESARELYKEGKELRQKGDLRGALERFKAAHEYGQTPVTGLELGKTHLQLGELVEAREVLLSIARLKVASDETEKSAAARTEAAELAEQIRPRISTVVVKVSGAPPDGSAQVTIDGANAPLVPDSSAPGGLSAFRKVNPGEHAVVVRAAGREEKRSVTLGEGEAKELPVTVGEGSPKPAGGASGDSARPIHVATWIGLGVGVAGLAFGSVAGAMALGKAGEVEDACVGLSCPTSARDTVEDGRTLATLSTVGFAVGVAGVALAAIGFFVLSPRKGGAAAGVKLALTPGGGAIGGTF